MDQKTNDCEIENDDSFDFSLDSDEYDENDIKLQEEYIDQYLIDDDSDDFDIDSESECEENDTNGDEDYAKYLQQLEYTDFMENPEFVYSENNNTSRENSRRNISENSERNNSESNNDNDESNMNNEENEDRTMINSSPNRGLINMINSLNYQIPPNVFSTPFTNFAIEPTRSHSNIVSGSQNYMNYHTYNHPSFMNMGNNHYIPLLNSGLEPQNSGIFPMSGSHNYWRLDNMPISFTLSSGMMGRQNNGGDLMNMLVNLLGNHDEYSANMELSEILGDVQKGMNDEEIEKIPTKKYDPATYSVDTCPISLQKFEDGDEIIEFSCKHIFKKESVAEWLKVKNICPYCEAKI